MHGGPNVHVLEFLLILGIGLIPQIVGKPWETAAFGGGFLEWGYPNTWISMVFMETSQQKEELGKVLTTSTIHDDFMEGTKCFFGRSPIFKVENTNGSALSQLFLLVFSLGELFSLTRHH